MSTCPICLEENPDCTIPVCGHQFHKECISKWLALKPECPLCRKICINTFVYFYRFKIIKKGLITINENAIILNERNFFKGYCRPMKRVILFDCIKRIEYTPQLFLIYYLKHNVVKCKKIYTHVPQMIFNLCKYHFYNSNRTLSI